ncbi:hypothetical protein KIN34_14310 [Cellulomonas sp. DKR-3]|uniref:Uncharacterized protein n=1 Tax=Cellulomonas fulva TaxID=2835530 RepID=A0ABS5U270_9CELL|nr:hypothetical protein [Cellulomonas fulva]MBT0995457.1 hypothetical protein [Cellulomonas fulva]
MNTEPPADYVRLERATRTDALGDAVGTLDDLLAAMPHIGSLDDDEFPVYISPGWAALDDAQPDALRLYARVRFGYMAFNSEPVEQIADDVLGQARVELQLVADQVLPTIASLTRTSPAYSQEAFNIYQGLERAWKWWKSGARPHIRGDLIDAAARVAEIEELARRAAENEAAVDAVSGRLREFAASVGTGELAKEYADQAKSHRVNAARWAWAVAVFGAAVVVAGLVLFAGETSPAGDAGSVWLDFAHDALAKVLLVGGLSYGIAFSAKAYRTNTHLAAVYNQKATALRTFPLFAAAVEGDDARSLVLAELVRSVFSSADTGVLDGGGSDRTIIENSLPLLTQLGPKSGG